MRHLEARLVRHVPVRLVDFSLSGCRIATDHPIDWGAEGELSVQLEGKRYKDAVRIVRSTTHQGLSHRVTVGGEFAWANRRGTTSIRGTVPSNGRMRQRHSDSSRPRQKDTDSGTFR